MVLQNLDAHRQKYETTPLHLYHILNSSCNESRNYIYDLILSNYLRKTLGELCKVYVAMGKNFLDKILEAQSIKEKKIDKQDYNRLRSACTAKETLCKTNDRMGENICKLCI